VAFNQPASRGFSTAAFAVLGINVFVVVWGALVRASGSGAGCGDHWPLCNGVVIPQAPAIQTIIEFTHRITSGLALIAAVALCVWCYRIFPRKSQVRLAATWSVAFLFAEALLGAGLVLLKYVGENASAGRAIYLSAHLTNTLLLLGALSTTAWLARKPGLPVSWKRTPLLLRIAILGIVLVSVTGAIAALGDTLFPAQSLKSGLKQDFSAAAHLLLRLRVFHPVLAIAVGIFAGVAAFRILKRQRITRNARNFGVALLLLVALQLWAGAANLAMLAPVWMQLVHLLLADLLWIALLLFSLELAQTMEFPPPVQAGPAAARPRPKKIAGKRTSARARR
jgi:heme A synthase